MGFIGKWFGFGHDAAFDDGVRAFERRDYEIALESFRITVGGAADRSVKDRARSYIAGCLGKLARLAYERRDFDGANGLILEATAIRPGFADLWLIRGRIEKGLGEPSLARESVETALEINPNYGAALVLRGVLLMRSGEVQLGFRSVEEGVRLDSRLVGAAWDQGEALFRAGDYVGAADRFDEIEPRGSDVHDVLAQADDLAKRGDWSGAMNGYERVLEIAPGYADVWVRQGQALMETGELDLAHRAFQRAIAVNPEFADAYALLGVVVRRQGDEENAMFAFRKALEFDSGHPIASQEVLYRRR
jgi:tetratricopeptide (TPR) repeat protein